MTEKLILGGLEVSLEHARELAWEYMNLTGTLDEAGSERLSAIADLYGVLDGRPTPQLRLVNWPRSCT